MRAAGGLGRDQQSAERLGRGWDLCSLDNPPTNQQQIQKGDQGRKKRRKATGLSEGQTEEIHGPEDSKPDVSLMLLCQVRTPPRRAAVSSGGEGLAAGSPQQPPAVRGDRRQGGRGTLPGRCPQFPAERRWAQGSAVRAPGSRRAPGREGLFGDVRLFTPRLVPLLPSTW